MSTKEGKNLVIVESPGKIKKLQEALGSEFVVKASIGHIRDLDENGLSIDLENGFAPKYVIPAEKKKVVADLKKELSPETPEEPAQEALPTETPEGEPAAEPTL